MVRSVAFAILLLCVLRVQADEFKQELRLTAAELFRQAAAENVQLSADGKSLEVLRGVLIETDGDAAGYSYKPNEETLSDGTTAIKWLSIPGGVFDSIFPKAYLLVGHTGQLTKVEVNGQAVKLGAPEPAGNYWKRYEIPSHGLKEGHENEFRLQGDGKLWIARLDDRPEESRNRASGSAKIKAKSKEVSLKLGSKDDTAGEYYVRLYLDVPKQPATLRLKLDALRLTGDHIPAATAPRSLRVKIEGDFDEALLPDIGLRDPQDDDDLAILLEHAGKQEFKFVPSERVPIPRDLELFFFPRFQGGRSPLTAVKIETIEPDLKSEANKSLQKITQHNPQWRHSKFDYEDLKHPHLAELRKQYSLDEVVKGCTTDLQRMEKLAVWTSQQWTKGHLGKIYPKWDALEILKKHEDGTPIGGFCQQYNIVFLQACESFGLVGRCVSIGSGDHGVKIRSGHEVVEIWSNELSKWVYVDGQAAWYFVDKETRTPLNLLELRDRQLAAIFDKSDSKESKREVDVVVLAKSPYEWKGLQDWPAFTELRMIPHTAFLDGIVPLPLNQGMRGWFWTGHRVWTDELYPASVLYSDRVSNVNDWNWPINQTRICLQQNVTTGTLDVRLNHNMPSFAKFVARIDGEAEKDLSKDTFTWSLRAGENRLQVQAVNVHGIRGPASWIKVEYKP
jgi:hypothetical protein